MTKHTTKADKEKVKTITLPLEGVWIDNIYRCPCCDWYFDDKTNRMLTAEELDKRIRRANDNFLQKQKR